MESNRNVQAGSTASDGSHFKRSDHLVVLNEIIPAPPPPPPVNEVVTETEKSPPLEQLSEEHGLSLQTGSILKLWKSRFKEVAKFQAVDKSLRLFIISFSISQTIRLFSDNGNAGSERSGNDKRIKDAKDIFLSLVLLLLKYVKGCFLVVSLFLGINF